MKGDYVVVVDRVYRLQFGEITEVDLVTQSLTFFSSELGMLSVPIRETAFNPNPTALRYTNERGYDVVAGDTVRVVRGERLHLSGTVLHVNLEQKTLTIQVTPYTKVCLHKFYLIHFQLYGV
jgi:ribosomal protein L24